MVAFGSLAEVKARPAIALVLDVRSVSSGELPLDDLPGQRPGVNTRRRRDYDLCIKTTANSLLT